MTAVVMEFLVWLADFLFGTRKANHGKHWAHTVQRVEADYHPMPELCAYPNLWQARTTGRVDYLRVPLKTFKLLVAIAAEVDRVIYLDNYRWKDVPVSEWPEGWRVQNG